jgi:hypothetical protein
VLFLAELLLGIMLFVGFKPKLVTWSLLVLILIFLFLTWYSAYYDKVTDCGCFGDAITLTPWETFYKNVVLIILIILLVLSVKFIEPLKSKNLAKWISFASLMISLFISYYVLVHLPIIDFRAYAIGKNIPAGMITPKDAKPSVYSDTWIYKINGVDKEFTTEEKPWNIEGATFVDRKTKLIEKGYEPPIHDFTMEKDGVDFTDFLMEKEKLMLIVMYDLRKSDKTTFNKIKETTSQALQNGYDVFGFSASSLAEFEKVKKDFKFDFDLLFCDETTLKTMVRANPGIITLNKGTITGKWNANDADKIKFDQ